ncbi:MAG: hypothetical protein R2734_11805 [Nocardioides sp.]
MQPAPRRPDSGPADLAGAQHRKIDRLLDAAHVAPGTAAGDRHWLGELRCAAARGRWSAR